MPEFILPIGLDQPAEYLLKIQGRVTTDLSDWFVGPVACRVETEEGNTVTALEGMIADQAALHGLLRAIRDLSMTLLYVDCRSARAGEHESLEDVRRTHDEHRD